MSTTARFYRKRSQQELRDVRSDMAAKQYAGRRDYDSIEIQSTSGEPRYYILSRSEGRQWMGPWDEEFWSRVYLKGDDR